MTAPNGPKAGVLGPGSLTFTVDGAEADFACQVTTIKITTDSDSDDPIPVLCGQSVAGDSTDTFALEANFLQDYDKDGCIDWSWLNMNKEVPFTFVPNSARQLEVSGVVQVKAMEIGGDVKKKNTSEVEWPIIGTPTLTFPTTP